MAQQSQVWDIDSGIVVCGEACGCDCDCMQYHTELREIVPRLCNESRTDVQVIELDGPAIALQKSSELENYLKKSNPSAKPITRVFLIPQTHSFSRLLVTSEALRKLCRCFEIYPQFIDILRAFGEKTDTSEDSYNAFNARVRANNGVYESSYIVKHVEKHDRSREDPQSRWSFRQSGFYQQSHKDIGSTVIIINPSKAFFLRLKQLNDSRKLKTVSDVQALLLTRSMQQWRMYQSDLENRVNVARRNAQLAEVKTSAADNSTGSEQDLKFENIQDLHALQDQSIQLCQHININLDLLRLVEADLYPHEESSTVPSLIRNMEEQSKRALVTLSRIEGSLHLVKSLLDFRSLDTANSFLKRLEVNAAVMTEMTKASQKEALAVVELGRKASRDTDTLKIITFLGLVYLPAAFCSSLMDMDYIQVKSLRSEISIKFDPGFYAFLVITFALWAATFGAYFAWSAYSRKAARKQVSHQDHNGKVV